MRQFSVGGTANANGHGDELPPAFEDLDLLDALALSAAEDMNDLGDTRRPTGHIVPLNRP
jgi:hypothetical protein